MNLSQDEINAMLTGGAVPDDSPSDAPVVTEAEAAAADIEGLEAPSESYPEEQFPEAEEQEASEIVAEETEAYEAVAEEQFDPESILAEYTGGSEPLENMLTDVEVDTLGEVGNICMGAVATTMYMLLDRRVEITTPRVEVLTLNDVLKRFPAPLVVVEVEYVEGITGRNLLLLEEMDAALITDILMGGEGVVDEPIELSELHMSAINEIMNQMIGSSATALSKVIGRAVNISTPVSRRMTLDENNTVTLGDDDIVIVITFDMEIEGLLNSQLVQFIPYNQGREMSAMLVSANEPEPTPPEPELPALPDPVPSYSEPAPAYQAPAVTSPPAYQPPAAMTPAYSPESLNLIHDIPVQVSVELGRTKKEISEILDFDSGTVVVLDKTAGDPVEVFVNGKLVASGEVVVIDENYGVRITAIHG